MNPYLDQEPLLFVITLWQRLFMFLFGQLPGDQLVTEDLQLLSLLISGSLGIFAGFYLIYNKMTMLANSLSHTILLGIVVTFLTLRLFHPTLGVYDLSFGLQMIAAGLTAVLTMIFLRFLTTRINPEASNALSFTGFFALGILITSLVLKNTHLGLESVMGNLEAVSMTDVKRLFLALLITLFVLKALFTRLNVMSFDELFAKTLGIRTSIYKNILIFVSALVLMVCFRSLGVILVLSLLTSPVLTARLFYFSKKSVFLASFGLLAFQSTLCLTLVQWFYQGLNMPISTSGLFGALGLVIYLVGLGIKRYKKNTQPC